MLSRDAVYLIFCPDCFWLFILFCSLVVVCLSLPTNCHTGGFWKYLSTFWVNECTHPFFCLFVCLFIVNILCSNKEKHKDFSCILNKSCSVSFVNSVNNHPEGIVAVWFFRGSFMLLWDRTVFEVWVSFFFLSDNAVNKMYVQYLRDFGWLLSSAVSCC